MTIFQVFLAVTSSRVSCFSGRVTAAMQGILHQWVHFSDRIFLIVQWIYFWIAVQCDDGYATAS